ncbi:hypothetical protein M501DRAFT_1016261 [Patellaria atrata CBS 101060]|uniref:Uncharacterized protein n=1 Tax=Patellaria atrata CBS 101060 TaxID=1346257 RepID=A0A9P4VT30_9PEZI|nr:hypothetical protein M501DRAFT_1016261 [Patellaria atrata CBS 101060]
MLTSHSSVHLPSSGGPGSIVSNILGNGSGGIEVVTITSTVTRTTRVESTGYSTSTHPPSLSEGSESVLSSPTPFTSPYSSILASPSVLSSHSVVTSPPTFHSSPTLPSPSVQSSPPSDSIPATITLSALTLQIFFSSLIPTPTLTSDLIAMMATPRLSLLTSTLSDLTNIQLLSFPATTLPVSPVFGTSSAGNTVDSVPGTSIPSFGPAIDPFPPGFTHFPPRGSGAGNTSPPTTSTITISPTPAESKTPPPPSSDPHPRPPPSRSETQRPNKPPTQTTVAAGLLAS